MSVRPLLALSILLTALLVPSAARAETVLVKDPVKDGDFEVYRQHADITRFRVQYAEDRIELSLTMRALKRTGADIYFSMLRPSKVAGYQLTINAVPGEITSSYEKFGPGFEREKACPGLDIDWRPQRDRVEVTIPKSCYAPIASELFFTGQYLKNKLYDAASATVAKG